MLLYIMSAVFTRRCDDGVVGGAGVLASLVCKGDCNGPCASQRTLRSLYPRDLFRHGHGDDAVVRDRNNG